MKICVAGWYFRPKFLQMVRDSGYESFVVKHREGDTQGIPSALHENRGLEFGAYREYVLRYWDGESDVLFLHDDAEVSDLSAFSSIESLSAMGVDQAYIFHDGNEEAINGGCHGRGIWIRGSVLKQIAGDFPADMDNEGVNSGLVAQSGILMFHTRLADLTKNTCVSAIVPTIQFAHRGTLYDRMFVFRRPKAVNRQEMVHA